MINYKFIKDLEDFLKISGLNCSLKNAKGMIGNYYNLNDSNGATWVDFHDHQMNRIEFLKELGRFNKKQLESLGVYEDYLIIYNTLNDKFGRKARIKKLLKEI